MIPCEKCLVRPKCKNYKHGGIEDKIIYLTNRCPEFNNYIFSDNQLGCKKIIEAIEFFKE